MAKRNKKGRKPGRSYQFETPVPAPVSTICEKPRRLRQFWAWLAGSGFVFGMANAGYDYIMGDLSLAYSKPIGQGYELIMANDGPFERVIDTFRVTFPPGQQVIYTVTQDTPMPFENGKVTMPGGPTWVPAAEFKELDGQAIGAHSQLKFRVPPLSNKSWLLPQASLVSVHFSSLPANPLLNSVEKILRRLHLVDQEQVFDFLIVDNYWSPVKSGTLKDAITQACREDSNISSGETCFGRKR